MLRLHAAADGSLARVRLPGGRVSARGLRAIGRLAVRGNGLVELTSRASVQVRGLDAGDAAWAADVLFAAGLLPAPEHDRVRNVLAAPLDARRVLGADAAVVDADAVLRGLDVALCADAELAALPGRFLFAVDDAGAGLATTADVTLGPDRTLWLAGVPTTLHADGAEPWSLMLDAARAFLSVAGEAWRIADLDDGAVRIAEALGGALRDGAPSSAVPPVPGAAVGATDQADGRVALTVLAPLGRVPAEALEPLALLAERTGADARVGTGRTITLVDVRAADAGEVVAGLHALGFVTEAGSGWAGLTACAGLGACASAHVDVRAAAAERAVVRGDGAPREHWAACPRGCGAPSSAAIDVRAYADGTLGVVRPGAPAATADSLSAALTLLATATAGGDA